MKLGLISSTKQNTFLQVTWCKMFLVHSKDCCSPHRLKLCVDIKSCRSFEWALLCFLYSGFHIHVYLASLFHKSNVLNTHTHRVPQTCSTVCYPSPLPHMLCMGRQISCTCSLTLSKLLFSFSQPSLYGKILTWLDHCTIHQRLNFPFPCNT